MAKPGQLPEWASNANFATGPDPGTATKLEPAAGVKQDGWHRTGRPPARHLNWWQNLVYQWLQHFEGSLPPDVQVFTSAGNWSKPDDAHMVHAILVAPGGGGGSGRRGAAATNRTGGCGGGGGAIVRVTVQASLLAATESVSPGTIGLGASGQFSDDTNGNDGQDATDATFANFSAPGGNGGGGGITISRDGPLGGLGDLHGQEGGASFTAGDGANGGDGSKDTGGALQPTAIGGGGGGGAGGSISAGDVEYSGGNGGSSPIYGLGGGSGGAQGGVQGNDGSDASANMPAAGGGGGGGGGGAAGGGAGGFGGNGGNYGGGGGGSGAALNGSGSGAGGDGGPGIVVVVTWRG